MRPPSPIRDPHARLVEALEGDATLDPRVRSHLVSVARQDRREALGTPVLYRAARAAALRLYAKVLTADPDGLTLARLCGEMVRVMRSLGMTQPARELFPASGGRRRRRQRDIFAVQRLGDEDEGDDDAV